MGQWIFSRMRGDDMRRGANDDIPFISEHADEEEYAGTDALVREILQNSLDAGTGNGPVVVRLALHEANESPPSQRLQHYFSRLEIPASKRGVDYRNSIPDLGCRFLVVEDFNTHGLEGDTLLFEDPEHGLSAQQSFYWFWRNIGRSGKTGVDLGRWGLGKTVYRTVSALRCMFGMTIRRSDRKRLLMGQSVLDIHKHENQEFKPEGFWCGERGEHGLPLPIEESDELALFVKEWHLSRKTEPGLSVVSPYVPQTLKADRLLQAVAVHFFTSILRGKLEVEISGQEIGTVFLNREQISGICRDLNWKGSQRMKRHVAPPIEFTRSCLEGSTRIDSPILPPERVPEWKPTVLEAENLQDLRLRFSREELVGVRIRLSLPRVQEQPADGEFEVWLKRHSDGRRYDSYYVREGMTITKINSQASKRGIQALVLVDQGPLAELLGDTEGPAHEDWDKSAERPNRIWKYWKGRVDFVRRAVDGLVEILTPSNTEPNFELLSDFFSIERPQGPQPHRAQGTESKQPSLLEPITADPKWYAISTRSGRGGFSVNRSQAAPIPHDAKLRVSVAYDLPKGDPLKNWSKLDFVISENGGALALKGKGLRAFPMTGNTLLLKDFQEEFQFVVEGFDEHRDLFIRIDDYFDEEEEAT